MKCRGECSKCSTLAGFRVKRINRKSITLAPLENVDDKWTEQKTVRIARWVKECSNYSSAKTVKPLFARDNTRIENEYVD